MVKRSKQSLGEAPGVPDPDGSGEADPLLLGGAVEEGTSPSPGGVGEEEDGGGSSHSPTDGDSEIFR